MAKHRWTKEELEALRVDYTNFGPQVCAEKLGVSISAVKKRAGRIGASKKRRNFTDSEIEYIKTNYAELGPIELSKCMGLKKDSIRGVARRLGIVMDPKARGKISSRTNKGRTMSDKCKEAIRKANKKHYGPNTCVDCGKEIVRKAKRCRECAAKERGGEGHNWWNGGVTPLYGATFKRLYPAWKFPIMARDDFQCQDCGASQCNLEVHHIRLFTEIRDKVIKANPHLHPQKDKYELAELIVREHTLDDGITLCRPCHEKRHWKEGDELLGNPTVSDEDNQQPSRLNVINMVDRKVQRPTLEESQPNKSDTSVPHTNAKV